MTHPTKQGIATPTVAGQYMSKCCVCERTMEFADKRCILCTDCEKPRQPSEIPSKEKAPPDIEYALTLMGCWARDKSPHGPAGACRLAEQVIEYQRREIERLRAALQKLDNGYKYPTEVVTIAREGLSDGSSAREAPKNDPTDWLAYLEATPHTEPYMSIARAWRADKAEIERLQVIDKLYKETCDEAYDRGESQVETDEKSTAFWKTEAIAATRIVKAAAKAFPNDDGWLHAAQSFLSAEGLTDETSARRSDVDHLMLALVQQENVLTECEQLLREALNDQGVNFGFEARLQEHWMKSAALADWRSRDLLLSGGTTECQNPNPGGGYCPDCRQVHATVNWPKGSPEETSTRCRECGAEPPEHHQPHCSQHPAWSSGKATAPHEMPARLIVSEEESRSPLAFRHWSKDQLVPYRNCHCGTCVEARSAQNGGANGV